MRGDAVIAVAGDEASDASHGVADGGSGSRDIEHGKPTDAVLAGERYEHRDTAYESAEPGKAAAEPVYEVDENGEEASRPIEMGKKRPHFNRSPQHLHGQAVGRCINHMPQLGAENPGD